MVIVFDVVAFFTIILFENAQLLNTLNHFNNKT